MSKAERVRKLGGIALCSIGQVARLQTIQGNDEDYSADAAASYTAYL